MGQLFASLQATVSVAPDVPPLIVFFPPRDGRPSRELCDSTARVLAPMPSAMAGTAERIGKVTPISFVGRPVFGLIAAWAGQFNVTAPWLATYAAQSARRAST